MMGIDPNPDPDETARAVETADSAASPEGVNGELTAAQAAFLLQLARRSITDMVLGIGAAEIETSESTLLEKKGCFVTLFCGSTLRGCIGNMITPLPLCRGVAENARAAASRDPRFPPLTRDDLASLRIEISVLTEPQPVAFNCAEELFEQLKTGEYGVLLKAGKRVATFLPQVWRQIPEPAEFLNRLAEKAGLARDAWRERGVSLSIYRVQAFEDAPDEHDQLKRPGSSGA